MTLTKSNLRMLDSGFITPLDFGAIGDDSNDDTTAVQSALDSTYGVVDLAGKTYKVTSTLTLTRSNVIIRNGTIRYAGTENTVTNILHIYGTKGSNDNNALTGNTSIGETTVTVGTTNIGDYSAGDWVDLIGTADVSSNSGGYIHGELHKIHSVDAAGGTFELLTPVIGNLKTSDSTTAQVIQTMLENITLDNVTIKAVEATETSLGANPLATTNGDATVTITTPSAHGLLTGDTIYLSQASSTGGITGAQLRGSFVITKLDATTLSIEAPTTATATVASGGGSSIKMLNGSNVALAIDQVTDVTIKNCKLTDVGYGIDLESVTVCSIENCRFSGPGFPDHKALRLQELCSKVTIKDNNFLFPGYGVYVGATTASCYDINIHDNNFDNVNNTGIHTTTNTASVRMHSNTMSLRNRFTDESNFSQGIVDHSWNGEITSNTIEGVTYRGIYSDTYFTIDDIFGGDEGALSSTYLPYPTMRISGNTILSSASTKGEHAIYILNSIVGDGHVYGLRITDNYCFGFHCGLMFKNTGSGVTTGNPGWKDSIITNNVFLGTVNSNSTSPQGIEFLNDSNVSASQLSTSVFSNNVFDTRGSAADINRADNIDFYDTSNSEYLEFSQSSFVGNIVSASNSTTSKAIVLSTSTSDPSQTSDRLCMLGNVFVNFGNTDTENDIFCTITGDSNYIVGVPTGNTSADTGTYWGLNCWSSIGDSGWTGTA